MDKKFNTMEVHWQIMLNYMEENLQFARGVFTSNDGKRKSKEQWDELTQLLNCAGLGARPKEKWQKAWTDFKSKTRQRAAQLRTEQIRTGGGENPMKPLTHLEQRLLGIFGNTCYQGTGTPERGFGTVRAQQKAGAVQERAVPLQLWEPVAGTSKFEPPEFGTVRAQQKARAVQERAVPLQLWEPVAGTSKFEPPESPVQSGQKRVFVEDAEETPRKRRKNSGDSELLYRETLEVLYHIDEKFEKLIHSVDNLTAAVSNGVKLLGKAMEKK